MWNDDDGPAAVVGDVADPVVQTPSVGLPKLDTFRAHRVGDPRRIWDDRTGGLFFPELVLKSISGLDKVTSRPRISSTYQFLSSEHHRARPGTTRGEVKHGCLVIRAGHATLYPHLPPDLWPVERQRRSRIRIQFVGLNTQQVGGEPPAVLIDVLQDQDARVGISLPIDRRKRHCVCFTHLCGYRLVQPIDKQLLRSAGQRGRVQCSRCCGEHRQGAKSITQSGGVG